MVDVALRCVCESDRIGVKFRVCVCERESLFWFFTFNVYLLGERRNA